MQSERLLTGLDQQADKVAPALTQARPRTLPQLFEQACLRYADRPAFSNLGRTLSYRELERLSGHFAAYLQHCTALRPGDRIAIQLPNLLQYPVVLFGALRAGLVVVNTNPLYTPREMLHQLKDSGARAMVLLANKAHDLESIIQETALETVIVTELGDALAPARRLLVNALVRHVKKMVPDYRLPGAQDYVAVMREGARLAWQPVPVSSDDLALLQYTGGTTGVAKGAMLSHRNLIANTLQVKSLLDTFTTPGREVAVAPLPLYHIYSFTLNCLLMLESGNQVVLITNPRDIPALVRELRRWPFTLFGGLNSLFVALCRDPGFQHLDFSTLKLTLSGGMSLTPAVAQEWKRVTGCAIVEGYGMTEASPIISVNPPDAIRLGSIGLPIDGTEVKVVDNEGASLPVGGVGELCVRGPQVMRGYWNQPEETRQVLDSAGWLHTGDIARIADDGYIHLLDRKKDVIIVSGFNVYPNEVEAVVMEHPDVAECVAVAQPDERHGEVIKLYVVAGSSDLSVKEIRDYCRQRLTAYKVPAQVEFCESLPKNAIGKVLRRVLRDKSEAC